MWSPEPVVPLRAKIERAQRRAKQNIEMSYKDKLGCYKFSSKQKHYPDLGSDTHYQYGLSGFVPWMSCQVGGGGGGVAVGEASCGVGRCRLFYFSGSQF